MNWVLFAQYAASFAGNWAQAYLQQAAGKAQSAIDDANTYSQNLVNNANADAANEQRAANNTFVAAQAAFSNLARSINNNSKLDASADQQDAITENLARLQDQAVRGSLDAQLRSAEQLGAMRAQAAANGVGGTTARMLQKALELTAARAQTANDDALQERTYDMLAQRAGLLRNTMLSLDEGQTFAPIDYGHTVAPLAQSPVRASQFAGSVQSQALLATLGQNAGSLANLSIGGESSSTAVNANAQNVSTNNAVGSFDGLYTQSGNSAAGSSFFTSGSGSSSIADFQLS
jgi:hypothetical protein